MAASVHLKPWGGICSIFESVKNLDRSLLHVNKQTLVEPKLSAVGTCKPTALIQSALEVGRRNHSSCEDEDDRKFIIDVKETIAHISRSSRVTAANEVCIILRQFVTTQQ